MKRCYFHGIHFLSVVGRTLSCIPGVGGSGVYLYSYAVGVGVTVTTGRTGTRQARLAIVNIKNKIININKIFVLS